MRGTAAKHPSTGGSSSFTLCSFSRTSYLAMGMDVFGSLCNNQERRGTTGTTGLTGTSVHPATPPLQHREVLFFNERGRSPPTLAKGGTETDACTLSLCPLKGSECSKRRYGISCGPWKRTLRGCEWPRDTHEEKCPAPNDDEHTAHLRLHPVFSCESIKG